MKHEIINGAHCFTLNLADQKKAQNEFFRRMTHIPGELNSRRIYAGVASEIFEQIFPDITAAIKTLRNEPDSTKKRPVLIQGFRMGRIAHDLTRGRLPQPANKHIASFFNKVLDRPHTPEPEHVLALATAWLLDPCSINGHFQNIGSGTRDPVHRHEGYSVVIGQHGVDGVSTRIWYPDSPHGTDPDFSAELKRGSLLIIPPEFLHDVEGFKSGRKVTNKGVRNTAAIIMEEKDAKFSFTAADLQAGRERYLLPPVPVGKDR